MGLATLAVNHAAAKVNVKAVNDVADSINNAYNRMIVVYNETLDLAFTYTREKSLNIAYRSIKDKLDTELDDLDKAADTLWDIAQKMQETVDLFTEEHLEEIRMSSSGVMRFDG